MKLIGEAQTAFTAIYDRDLWGLGTGEWEAERAGEEPEEEMFGRLAALVQSFMLYNDVKSVVEFGCGFWSYARRIDWTGLTYDGFDVVEGIIRHNSAHYGSDTIRFHRVADGVRLPSADLLISKDVLQHLPLAHVQHYFRLFRSNFKYMLLANDVVPEANMNGDIPVGGYRPLRWEREPFNERNAVLQEWVSGAFGIHSVKHFCLLFGDPVGDASGVVLRDDLDLEFSPEVERKSIARRAVGDLLRSFPPLARVSGYVLRRLR